MPPYCNPRGNWSECEPDEGETSKIEFSTEEISALAELEILPIVREETDRALGVAGGYAKLRLRWTEGKPVPFATLAVVSHRTLTSRTARELAERYQKVLNQEGVLSVEVERYSWPWQRDHRADWCELSRETQNQVGNVECGAE